MRTTRGLEDVKKLLELTTSLSSEKRVTGHDVHDMHIEMIRALRVQHGLMMSGGSDAPVGHNMTMGAPGMQRDLSPLTQSVRGLLATLGLGHLGEKRREEGVTEVGDLWDLADEELDSFGLKPVEKKRYRRRIKSLKASYE
jgi:hypothetical protein